MYMYMYHQSSLDYLYGIWIREKSEDNVYKWKGGPHLQNSNIKNKKFDFDGKNSTTNKKTKFGSDEIQFGSNEIQFDNNFTLPILSKDEYRQCQNRQNNLFLGESHKTVLSYIYIYIYTYIHVHIYTYTYIYIYISESHQRFTWSYHIYTYIYIHPYIHMYIHIHMHIYIYMYMHIHTYIYI
jgi:hypothetical protein